jgi:hypothetical protein
MGERSQFLGDISMRGLPVIDDHVMLKYMYSISVVIKADLEWLPVVPLKNIITLVIPESVNSSFTRRCYFQRKNYTASLRDFVCLRKIFAPALGSINLTLNLKYNEAYKTSAYSGTLCYQFRCW